MLHADVLNSTSSPEHVEFAVENVRHIRSATIISRSPLVMASILLFGDARFASPFLAALPASCSVFLHGADPATITDHAGVTPFMDGAELPADLSAVIDLRYDRAARAGTMDIIRRACYNGAPLITNSLTITATETASELGNVPTVGISYVPAIFGSATVLEAAPALQTSQDKVSEVMALLGELTGRQIEILTDRVALVSIRTLAMIVNEAAFALMEGVADPNDIDIAMKLGTGYPEGPLRWADMIGLDIILAVLQALHEEYGEERYRPCVLLKQHARAGKSLVGSA